MTQQSAIQTLLLALADVYAGEDRDGARALVAILRENAATVDPPRCTPYRLDAVILAATEGATHPVAKAARAAHSLLPWSATGILDEHIPTQVSDLFAVAALVGQGAMIHSDTCKAGLFVQCSGAFYPPHAHTAEETYVMLAGEADWQVDFGPWQSHRPGDMIHHPSEAAHATRTGALPILAAWRWSGDIRTETYRMIDAEGR